MAAPRKIPAEASAEIARRYAEGGEQGRTGVLSAEFSKRLGVKVTDENIRAEVQRNGVALRPRGGQRGMSRTLPGTTTVSTGPTAEAVAEANQDSATV